MFSAQVKAKFDIIKSKIVSLKTTIISKEFWIGIVVKIKHHYKKRPIVVVAIGVLIVVIPTIFFLFRGKKPEAAAWFSEGWRYRKPYTISYSGTVPLTNYQVVITAANVDSTTLNSQGKINNDCSDIRFTDLQGNLLDYWVKELSDTDDSVDCSANDYEIWIELQDIQPGGSTIYMYYGNPNAPPASDGDATFLFFDGFGGTDFNPDKESDSGSADFAVANGNAKVENDDNAWDSFIRTDTTFERSLPYPVLHAVYKASTDSTMVVSWHMDNDSSAWDDHIYSFYLWNPAYFDIATLEDGGPPVDSGEDITEELFFDYKIELKSAGAEYYYKLATSASWTSVASSSFSTSSDLVLWVSHWNDSDPSYLDSWFVYQKAATEPGSPSPGSEEEKEAPIVYYSFDEGAGYIVNNQINTTHMGAPPVFDLSFEDNDTASHSCVYGGNVTGACDYSGNALNAAAKGTLDNIDYVPGNRGLQSIYFATTNEYLCLDTDDDQVCDDDDRLDYAGDFSVEAWVKASTDPSSHPIVSKGNSSDYEYEISINAGLPQFKITQLGSTADYLSVSGSTSINDADWHYIVGTLSGTTVQIYVDGELENESSSTAGTRNTDSSEPLVIGGDKIVW